MRGCLYTPPRGEYHADFAVSALTLASAKITRTIGITDGGMQKEEPLVHTLGRVGGVNLPQCIRATDPAVGGEAAKVSDEAKLHRLANMYASKSE